MVSGACPSKKTDIRITQLIFHCAPHKKLRDKTGFLCIAERAILWGNSFVGEPSLIDAGEFEFSPR